MSVHVTLEEGVDHLVLFVHHWFIAYPLVQRISYDQASGQMITLSVPKMTLGRDPFSKQCGGKKRPGHMRLSQTDIPSPAQKSLVL